MGEACVLRKAAIVVLSDTCWKLRMKRRLTPASITMNNSAMANVPPESGHCHMPAGPNQNSSGGVVRAAAKNMVQKTVSACV